jgi:hypothetical protein
MNDKVATSIWIFGRHFLEHEQSEPVTLTVVVANDKSRAFKLKLDL